MPLLPTQPSLGSDGMRRLQLGARIRFEVRPSQEAFVERYGQDETRRTVRFFPNRFSKSPVVQAASSLKIPMPRASKSWQPLDGNRKRRPAFPAHKSSWPNCL
jgi:hypothetical protein